MITSLRAHHLDGGNFYDDFRIDIERAHREIDAVLPKTPRVRRRGLLRNWFSLNVARVEVALGLSEFLVVTGLRRKWMREFKQYWAGFLGGRTLFGSLNFFLLLHGYRVKEQHRDPLSWPNPEQHVANWQSSGQFHSLLHMVSKMALRATRSLYLPSTWRFFPRKARVLEYGCSNAPYYYLYRQYYSHRRYEWVLADIPNFAFHYAKFTYADEQGVSFRTIYAENFGDPLDSQEMFDVVILKEVFEHLDNPVFVAEYLLQRLRKGGILVFDYVKSEGTGLDHPRALEDREEALGLIAANCQILRGSLNDLDLSVGLTIARKIID